MNKRNDSDKWEQKQIRILKKDLKNIDVIYCVGLRQSINPNWDKGIWRYCDFYYVKNGKLERVFIYDSIKNKPTAWLQDAHCFEENCLGSNRFHEMAYSLYTWTYNGDPIKGLEKIPRIEFLSSFDGDSDEYDEKELNEGEG